MAKKRKYYVVWEGFAPGIYDSWEECEAQINGYPKAKYKSYPDQDSATEAFRNGYKGADDASMAIFRAMAEHIKEEQQAKRAAETPVWQRYPEVLSNAIAVDAACSGNPGPVEYRGVRVYDGVELFHVGPLQGGTNNIGEYLALIHVLALLKKHGDGTTPIYSDSRTAQAWLRNHHSNTKLAPTQQNARIRELLDRADAWISTNLPTKPVLKWDTDHWGEIPADFYRK